MESNPKLGDLRASNIGRAKILEITSYPPPRSGWGMRVEVVKKRLLEMGHVCQVLNVGESRKIESSEYICVYDGFDYMRKIFSYAMKGFLIHTHVNGDSPKGFVLTLLAEIVGALSGKRCVLTFHAGPKQRYFPKDEHGFLLSLMYCCMFRLPQRIVCNHIPVKKRIMDYGIRSDKITPIPAFSKQYMEFERVSLNSNIEGFFKTHEPIVCTYVFSRPEFATESLIKAVSKLVKHSLRLGLIIVGSDSGSAEMLRLVNPLKLQGNVLLAGNLSHDEFMTILGRSEMYIRTPAKDGVCSSVLEALSLGTPVIASENGTRPQGVITYRFADEEDLAEKVQYVLDKYNQVRSGICTPEVKDTVSEEAGLLLRRGL